MPVVPKAAGLAIIRYQGAVETVVMIKAPLERQLALIPVSKVPFADEGGVVAGWLEGLSERALVGQHSRNIIAVGALLHAIAKRIPAGKESRARRRTDRMYIELRESYAFLREPVEIGGSHGPAIETGVMPGHVISQKHHNVGFLG
jgi:hypothetical protein